MLHLHSPSSPSWLEQVRDHLPELLVDHAHCEKKAAGVAMNLIFAYVEDQDLCRAMTEIVQEELSHFHLVIDILNRRGIRMMKLKPSSYGERLHALIRKTEPERAIDRLLIAGLIEARSCERFGMLRDGLADRELADFFGGLFESEARHHSTYVRLARNYADADTIRDRLRVLAAAEADIIAIGDPFPRMHS